MSDVEEGGYDGGQASHSKSGSHSSAATQPLENEGGHSGSRSRHRHYSRSRSHSRRRHSRSRSYTPDYRRHSRSPMSNRRRHLGSRVNPDPSCCLGVFGLSLHTGEKDLKEVFSRYGPVQSVNVVYDQQSGRSRGFAFVYFDNSEDAKEAKERANGMELDGRYIRVDFSITKRAHTPTPGIYMGRPTLSTSSRRDGRDGRDGRDNFYERGCDRGYDRNYDRGYDRGGYERGGGYDRGGYDRGYDDGYRYDRYRRRSPSPYYRGGYRSRSRSYSPRRY
ncbi:transformer-2 protein homolog beta-like isoform X4 [Petromyzon marinus]|uniref:Transformer-2 protein homolog beta n=1 Tax=Petromyzon marinus TaxID=7757 RepID=A0AAJ7SN32_PETMA|nr:transformer-2 protein homolog beta-like isoform X6 [Petromyzon marinus]